MTAAVLVVALFLGQASSIIPTEEPWQGLWLFVRPGGVDIYGPYSSDRHLIPVSQLKNVLVALSRDAWPKGRIVVVQEMAFLPADDERLATSLASTLAVLTELNIEVERRPRATATVDQIVVIEREWEGTRRATTLHLLDEALAVTEAAIASTPMNQRALVCRVRFLEMKSQLTTDRQERATLRTEANRTWQRITAARLAPKPRAPASSSDLSAAIFGETFAATLRRSHAIEDTHSFWPRPTAYWTVNPMYAKAPDTEPIVQIIIGADGAVMNARLVRGEPAVARPSLEAAKLWFFTSPMVKGRAVAWVETLAFSAGR